MRIPCLPTGKHLTFKNNFIQMKYLLVLFSSLLYLQDGDKLVKTRIAEGISVSLPPSFVRMTDDDMAKKYFTYRKPTAMYTNPDRVVDFGFNQTETRWRQQDLPMLKDFYQSSILSAYSKVDFMQDTVAIINERGFVVFEFTSEVAEDNPNAANPDGVTRQYSYVQYTVKENKILVFNFTCPAQMQATWKEVAKQVMQSVKVSG